MIMAIRPTRVAARPMNHSGITGVLRMHPRFEDVAMRNRGQVEDTEIGGDLSGHKEAKLFVVVVDRFWR